MAVKFPQCLIENVKGIKVGRRRIEVTEVKGLDDAALVVCFVCMAEEDMSFPCLLCRCMAS